MTDMTLLKNIASTIAQIYFFNHDLQPAFSYLNKEQVTWIGLGGDMVVGYDNVLAFLGRHRDRDSECNLTATDYHLLSDGDEHAILIGKYTFDMLSAMDSIFYIHITYCFVKDKEDWKIVHAHTSSPSYGSYLDKRIRQIQLTTQTITVGLKGSLDDEKYTFTYVNDELCQMLGYTRDEFMEMSGGTSVGAIYPPDISKCCKEVKRFLAEGDDYRIEYRIRKKDGTLMWVMEYGKKIRDMEGKVQINSTVMDISHIKNTVSQLEIEKERNEIVAELSEDIVFDYDTKKDQLEIVYPSSMNHITHKKQILTNYLKGDRWKDLDIREIDNIRLAKRLKKELLSGNTHIVKEEYRYNNQDENSPWRRILVRGILNSDGEIARIVGKVFDITSEKQLVINSTTDSLTGAYNRNYLKQEVARYLSEKNNDLYYACMLIDIDYFKEVNDKYGHLQGDEVLKRVVNMLKNMFRKTDVVARLGGDEFMVFIEDIYDIVFLEEKAANLLKQIKQCCIKEKEEEKLSVSIGITISDSKEMNINTLYHQADVALYNAKELGRGRYLIYTDKMEYPRARRR